MSKYSSGSVRWISRLLISLGLGWVAVLIFQEASTVQKQFQTVNGIWLAASFAFGTVHLLLAAMVFSLLLRLHGPRSFRFTYIARLFYSGLILKHLPGRFWGVAYQLNETRQQFPTIGLLRANIDFIALTLIFQALIAVALYLFFYAGFWIAFLFSLFSFICIGFSFRRDWIGICLGLLVRFLPTHWLPEKLSKIAEDMKKVQIIRWSEVIKIMLVFIAMGIVYLFGWHTFIQSFPELDHINSWILCAAYSVAWICGYISILTPSGIGVREAVFIMLGSNFMVLPSLAFLSVCIRLWQIVLELSLFFFFFLQKQFTGSGRALDHVID